MCETMTEKELAQLKRTDLLELLLEQSKEVELLKSQLEEANKELKNRQIKIEEAGSIAEAALQVNGVFEAAQEAAYQYLENIKNLSRKQDFVCARREEKCREELALMRRQTEEECQRMVEDTKRICEEMRQQAMLSERKDLQA